MCFCVLCCSNTDGGPPRPHSTHTGARAARHAHWCARLYALTHVHLGPYTRVYKSFLALLIAKFNAKVTSYCDCARRIAEPTEPERRPIAARLSPLGFSIQIVPHTRLGGDMARAEGGRGCTVDCRRRVEFLPPAERFLRHSRPVRRCGLPINLQTPRLPGPTSPKPRPFSHQTMPVLHNP